MQVAGDNCIHGYSTQCNVVLISTCYFHILAIETRVGMLQMVVYLPAKVYYHANYTCPAAILNTCLMSDFLLSLKLTDNLSLSNKLQPLFIFKALQ